MLGDDVQHAGILRDLERRSRRLKHFSQADGVQNEEGADLRFGTGGRHLGTGFAEIADRIGMEGADQYIVAAAKLTNHVA